jgi:hypothetical protein
MDNAKSLTSCFLVLFETHVARLTVRVHGMETYTHTRAPRDAALWGSFFTVLPTQQEKGPVTWTLYYRHLNSATLISK